MDEEVEVFLVWCVIGVVLGHVVGSLGVWVVCCGWVLGGGAWPWAGG